MSEPPPDPAARGSEPLAPDASIDDILARVGHLGGSSAGSAPGAEAPEAPVGVPAPAGPGDRIPVPDLAAAPPPRRRRTGVIAALGGLLALVVGIGGKLILGLAVVGVGGQVLSSIFGGPFDKLPQATKDSFEQRLNAALGPDADKLSESDYAAKYDQLLLDGEPRLDDGPLINELVYLDKMFAAADVKTCAEAARSEFGSTGATFQLSDTMWATLSQDELTNHIETQISAVEAAARQAPPPHTVTSDEASSAISAILGALADQSTILNDLSDGTARTDDEACTAARAFHHAEVALSSADLALIARFSVSP
jgi:hypothetical protein